MAKKKSDEDVKSEIIKAANTLFVKYGFNKTTMEDIAKLAGKGKSTLYYYYKSKDEVIIDVTRKIASDFQRKIQKEIARYSTAKDKLTEFFKLTVKYAEKLSTIYFLPRQELSEGFFIKPNHIDEIDENGIQFIRSILTLGINNKEFSSIIIDETMQIAEIINCTIKSLVMSEMLGIKNQDWDKKILKFGEILIRGII